MATELHGIVSDWRYFFMCFSVDSVAMIVIIKKL